MSSRKQIQRDYENRDYLDKNGKIKTEVVYRGKFFRVPQKKASLLKNLYTIFTIVATALFITSLAFNTPIGKAVYFVLPFVALCFPIFYVGLSAYRIWVKKLPYKQEDKNVIFDKTRLAAVFGVGLSAAAVVGGVVKFIALGAKAIDALPFGSAVLIGLGFLYILGIVAKIQKIDLVEHNNADGIEYNAVIDGSDSLDSSDTTEEPTVNQEIASNDKNDDGVI